MKIGIYSVTYRGVWYKGDALDLYSLMRVASKQGWEGVELDAERPHATPMDLSVDDRKRFRDLSGELSLPICAISPNCDLSSPVPVQRETMISYVRDCITLARDLGAPICKIFAAWRGITLHDGLATYADTYGYDQYGYWKGDRREFVVAALRELTKVAEDHGDCWHWDHGPDVVVVVSGRAGVDRGGAFAGVQSVYGHQHRAGSRIGGTCPGDSASDREASGSFPLQCGVSPSSGWYR